jgi:inhibitor of cysteine peptidase
VSKTRITKASITIKNGGVNMKKPNVFNWIVLVALVILIAFVAYRVTMKVPNPPPTPGVPGTPGTYSGTQFDPTATITSGNFKTAEELNSFLNSHSSGSGYYGRSGGVMYDSIASAGGAAVKMAAETSSSPQAPAPNTAATANDFSQTNNQVASVDEADLIKTDGNYIYTVRQHCLYHQGIPGRGCNDCLKDCA